LAEEKIETALVDPGKPWQNGTNESFNGKFPNECLSMECFRNRCPQGLPNQETQP
jgi:putative transposase